MPVPLAFLSPLMLQVRPLQPCHLAGPPLFPPPPPRFILRWGRACVSLGGSPHLLYQAAYKGRACLLRGCPPISFFVGGPPPLSPALPHAVRWERMLLGGCPLFGALI